MTVRSFLSVMALSDQPNHNDETDANKQAEQVRVAAHSLDQLCALEEGESVPGCQWFRDALLSFHAVALRESPSRTDTDLETRCQVRVLAKHAESRRHAAQQVLIWAADREWTVDEALGMHIPV